MNTASLPPSLPPPRRPVPAPVPAARSRHVRVALAGILATGLAALAAGCGSSGGSGTEANPASVIPATAELKLGAVVRPGGSLKAGALAAGRALAHTQDPYLRLLGALETPGSPKLSYARDVAPWLGKRAAVFLTSLGSAGQLSGVLEKSVLGEASPGSSLSLLAASGSEGAIVMDTSDLAAARSFVREQAARAGARAASYRGVPYQMAPSGLSFGVVERFAVIGGEGALHEVIDTSLGGPSLARSSDYRRLDGAAPQESLARVFVRAPLTAAVTEPQNVVAMLGLLAGTNRAQLSVVASPKTVTVDADALGRPRAGLAAGFLTGGGQAARALEELPGESWLALGLGNLGSNLPSDVEGIHALLGLLGGAPPSAGQTTGTVSLESLLGALLTPLAKLGADTAQAAAQFRSWMGSGGVFAAGASLFELKGAVVISSSDAARSRAAVSGLASELHQGGALVSPVTIAGAEAAVSVRLEGLPLALDIAAGRDGSGAAKFVIALGKPSVAAALDPSSTLASGAARRGAAGALGEGIAPALLLDVPTLLGLLESVGLTDEASFARLLPYLRSLTTVAAGAKSLGGGVGRVKVVAGLG